MNITDLLTALHRAGVAALDLDPVGNRLRCLPETPQECKPLVVAHKGALLGLAFGERCTITLAAAPGSDGYSFGEVAFNNGAVGFVTWDDALDLVLAEFPTEAAAKAYAEALHAATLAHTEGVSYAN